MILKVISTRNICFELIKFFMGFVLNCFVFISFGYLQSDCTCVKITKRKDDVIKVGEI